MHPSDWVQKNSTPLSLDQFSAEFMKAWSQIKFRFFKLECWQNYQESEDNESQEAYNRGDLSRARELLWQEAEADRQLYEDVKN